jgi:N6-L-threonylcarbamoyladenine synthase
MHNILAIESSCDETAVAIYNSHDGLLAHSIFSQIDMHKEYGGVVPELASRDHLNKICPLIYDCINKVVQTGQIKQANISLDNIDAIAYTAGPGLAGALLVGAGVANSLAYAAKKPIIPIHHLEGHILSPLLDIPKQEHSCIFPFMCLLVSGGNTQLILVKNIGEYTLLGETLDDAAGEAFDKTAKILGMPYPGGALVSMHAEQGQDVYNFPRPMLHSKDLDFSFSGLKTAVLNQVQKIKLNNININVNDINQQDINNICASFVASSIDVLVHKSINAMNFINSSNTDNSNKVKNIIVCGGVSANKQLRAKMSLTCAKFGYNAIYPSLQWCTDNAAMIALSASLHYSKNTLCATYNYDFAVYPRWELYK